MDAARTFSVFADYNQFFLLDDIVQPPYPDVIPQSAIEQRFQIIPHLIAVYTSDATTVSVKVKICEVEPKPNLESWSHIVRCPLEVPSGRMTLAGCTDYLPSCPRIEVPSGKCGVLISARGLGDGESEEYLLQIWPGVVSLPTVIKSYVAHNG